MSLRQERTELRDQRICDHELGDGKCGLRYRVPTLATRLQLALVRMPERT
jgi:hypothetical protein